MAGKRGELVPRPPKKMEYEIRFATTDARKGWQDLAATIRNPLAEAWDFLTRTPLAKTPSNYPLRGAARSLAGTSSMSVGSTNRRSRAPPASGSSSTTARCIWSRCTPVTRTKRSRATRDISDSAKSIAKTARWIETRHQVWSYSHAARITNLLLDIMWLIGKGCALH